MILADSSLAALLRMLADSPEPDAVAAAIAQGALSAFRPIVAAIGFVHIDRQVLEVVGGFGHEPETRHLYSAVPLDADIPATVCYRTNAIVTTPSARLAADYPLAAPYVNSGTPPVHGEFTAFPIRYRGAVIAVLGLEFDRPLAEPWFLRSAVSTISGPLAMWAALRMQSRRRPRRLLVATPGQTSHRDRTSTEDHRHGARWSDEPTDRHEIGFSVPTVKSELARLRELLGATSRSDLVAKAARAGF